MIIPLRFELKHYFVQDIIYYQNENLNLFICCFIRNSYYNITIYNEYMYTVFDKLPILNFSRRKKKKKNLFQETIRKFSLHFIFFFHFHQFHVWFKYNSKSSNEGRVFTPK